MTKNVSPLNIDNIMYTSWFTIGLCTAQNTNHLEFNFNLLILDKISTDAVAPVVSMVAMTLC